MAEFNMHKDSVLFVCAGNTCRSPMAEYLYTAMAAEKGINAKAASRGISASSSKLSFGLGPSLDTCNAVLELFPQSEIYLHEPEQLRFKDLKEWRWILTMEESHRQKIIEGPGVYMPDLKKRAFALKEFAGLWDSNGEVDIADPIGGYSGAKGDYSSGYFIGGSRFDVEVVDVGGVGSVASARDEKAGSRYKTCRDEIVACLTRIVNGDILPVDAILDKRKERFKRMYEAKIERELRDYRELLTKVEKAERGDKVKTTYSLESDVENPPKDKKYLHAVLAQIARVMKDKKLEFDKGFSSVTIVSPKGVGNGKAKRFPKSKGFFKKDDDDEPTEDNIPTLRG